MSSTSIPTIVGHCTGFHTEIYSGGGGGILFVCGVFGIPEIDSGAIGGTRFADICYAEQVVSCTIEVN